jgi:hypothetical protein
MEKKYVITSLLTLVFTTLISVQSFAQVRITQVDPTSNVVTIHNFGGATVDISSYFFCQWPSYFQVSFMAAPISGSTTLISGADVTITSSVNFGIANGEFGLYSTSGGGTFNSGMVDYLEWGTSGHFREGLAVSLGLWATGTTITAPAPYEYTGNGSQNGVAFWGTVLGIEDFKNQTTFSIFPNPTNSILNLQLAPNFVNGTINIFNLLGKQVLTKEINSNNFAPLDVTTLSKGLYLIKVTSGNNTQTKRFVKQ